MLWKDGGNIFTPEQVLEGYEIIREYPYDDDLLDEEYGDSEDEIE